MNAKEISTKVYLLAALALLASLLVATGSGRSPMWPARGEKALLAAIARDDADAVRRALASGVSPNIEFEPGGRPLQLAAAGRNPEVLSALIEYGAGVEGQGTFTPLHSAVMAGRMGNVRVLLAAGADPDGVPGQRRSPIELAREYGHADVARLLADYQP